jgi:uncharacterized protein (DUF2336 family)
MLSRQSLIDDLESAIANGEIGRRAESLRRVTDLFVSGAAHYTDEQVALFDDVMGRLASEIESSARSTFGQRLMTVPNAPPGIIRTLALDDAIEVAGPILSQSEQLDDATLVEGARTKGQEHLLAIAGRKSLAEAVTDVLVERGNQQVAQSTAANPGARFSEFGYSTLVKRSEDDAELALRVWARPEIPRQHLLKLFGDASESVRAQLEVADHRKADLIRDMVARAAEQVQTQSRECSAEYILARAQVRTLQDAGKLDEHALQQMANAGKFDETAIALSMMCNLPIGLIERAVAREWSEQILVLAKSIGLSWDTTKAILLLQAGTKGSSTHEIHQCFERFGKLQPQTAKKVIEFYRLRERAATAAQSH